MLRFAGGHQDGDGIKGVRFGGDVAFELPWQSVKGRTYKVFSTTTPTAWSAEPVQTFEGTGEVISILINQTQALELFKVTVELTK